MNRPVHLSVHVTHLSFDATQFVFADENITSKSYSFLADWQPHYINEYRGVNDQSEKILQLNLPKAICFPLIVRVFRVLC